jgi:hypothetical protein
MNSWPFRSLVALYPKAWRDRYSKEVGTCRQNSWKPERRPDCTSRWSW